MADPKWRKLEPVFSEAVSLLANVTSMPILLDRLLSEYLLYEDQYEQLYRHEEYQETARHLLRYLMRRPRPSYDRFCEVLCDVEGGERLFRLLNPASGKADFLGCQSLLIVFRRLSVR